MTGRGRLGDERGAIMVFMALLLVVLFGFAALGVDATHAFAEKREAQSTVDAAALAAGLEFLASDSPSNQDLYDRVKYYTDTNWGWKAPTDAEWGTCLDPDKPIDYEPIKDSSVSPATTISDCISIKQVDGEPALLRVKLPIHAMDTAFAKIMGFDTVDVSATATVEIEYAANTKVLPFSVPVDADGEECISTPPSGLLPEDPSVVCDGPTQGNFGMIDSPFFGAGDPHYTIPVSCPSSPNFNSGVATHNIALGVDHPIRPSPNPPAVLGQDAGSNPVGGDHCNSAASGDVPWILRTETGNTVTSGNPSIMEIGFLGEASQTSPQTTASVVGRLRQPSSLPSGSLLGSTERITFRTTSNNYPVDNVGLWEYLLDDTDNDACDRSTYSSFTGRELTDRLDTCLTSVASGQIFADEILESPRFAVVPRLNYLDGSNFGSKWWDIISMDAVFLWASWYDCTNGGDNECLFYPDNFTGDPTLRESYSLLHIPGEGSAEPCYLDSSTLTCETPSAGNWDMQGISALLLDWDWFPADAKNQYGGTLPFEIYLHPNE